MWCSCVAAALGAEVRSYTSNIFFVRSVFVDGNVTAIVTVIVTLIVIT